MELGLIANTKVLCALRSAIASPTTADALTSVYNEGAQRSPPQQIKVVSGGWTGSNNLKMAKIATQELEVQLKV